MPNELMATGENKPMVEDKKPKKSLDPYTGEERPEAEDAGKMSEIVPVDPGDREGKRYVLTEETSLDNLAADADADETVEQSSQLTEENAVEEDFDGRQRLASDGSDALQEELEDYNSLSPKLSGGDIDAKWQYGSSGGEETVGGTVPTPDQDIVEELGEAVGLTYEDDEPLQTEEKLLERDQNRYELNPESEDDQNEDRDREQEMDEQ